MLQIVLKFSSLKQKICIIYTVSTGQGSRKTSAGWFWHRGSPEVSVKMSAEAAIIWSLPGTEDFISKMAQLHDYWLEPSVYHRLLTHSLHTSLYGLLIELLRCSYQWQLASPGAGDPRKKARRKPHCLIDTVLEVVYQHLYFT